MHIGLIIDEERLAQEQSMLNRLCIGLMAEGAQVTRIVPDSLEGDTVDEGEQRVALAARVEAPMRVLPWMRQSRVNAIAEALEKSTPDVLYAVGERAWPLGLDLADALARPVLLDVCSIAQARVVPRGHQRNEAQALLAGYVAPCPAIATIVRDRGGHAPVSIVPVGVSSPPQARAVLSDSTVAPALVIIGDSRDLHAYEALLSGLRVVCREVSDLQIFLELHGPQEHAIWARAEKLELLGCISAISRASAYRSLLTRCDLMLLPERPSQVRSVVLEAMALAMPIISNEDRDLGILADGRSAIFVRAPEADCWAAVIRGVLHQPEPARRVGLSARQVVLSSNRSSDQVARLLQTLQEAVGPSGLRFSARG